MRLITLILMTVLFAWPTALCAYRVADLGRVKQTVSDQSATLRDKAIQSAFETVLIRLTGDPNVLSLPSIMALKDNARIWMTRYYYEKLPTQFELVIDFDLSEINKQLAQKEQAWLGEERPLLLSLLLVSTQSDPNWHYINRDNAVSMVESLQTLSKHYGVPLAFPLLDLSEKMVLPTRLMTVDEVTMLAPNLKKYQTDSFINGAILERQGQWYAQYLLNLSGQVQTWEGHAASFDEMAEELVLSLLRRMAQRYAILPTISANVPALTLTVTVTHVYDIGAYATLMQYVKSLSLVETVSVKSVDNETVQLQLVLRGSGDDFMQSISLSRLFDTDQSQRLDANRVVLQWH